MSLAEIFYAKHPRKPRPARRPARARPRPRPFLLEPLEGRILLAADILPGVQTAIIQGLDSMVDLTEDIETTGALGTAVPIVNRSIGETLDLSSILQAGLVDHVESYFTAHPNDATVEGLQAALQGGSGLSSVTGSFTAGDELRFDLTLTAAKDVTGLATSLGDGAVNFGLLLLGASPLPSATLETDLELVLSFGVDLAQVNLAPAEAFFIRDASFDATAAVEVTGIDANARVGILDLAIEDGSLTLEGAIHGTFGNPDGDAEGNLTRTEIEGHAAATLVTLTGTGQVDGALPVRATIGDFTTIEDENGPGTLDDELLALGVRDSNLFDGVDPVITPGDPDAAPDPVLSELQNFRTVTTAGLLDQIEDLGLWFTFFDAAGRLDVAVPLLDSQTFADLFNLGTDFNTEFNTKVVNALRDAQGNPNFASAQQLLAKLDAVVGLLDVEADYDAATDALTWTFSIERTATEAVGVDFSEGFGALQDVESASDADVEGTFTFAMTFGVDLSPAGGGPEPGLPERFFVRDTTATAVLELTFADIDFTGRYGFMNITGADGDGTADATLALGLGAGGVAGASLSLVELFAGLLNPAGISALELTGEADITLTTIAAAGGILTLPPGAELTLAIGDLADLGAATVTPNAAAAALNRYVNVDFDDVVAALQAMQAYLQTLVALPAFGGELPLVDRSFRSFLDPAAKLAADIADIATTPASTVQELEAKIEQALGYAAPTPDVEVTLSADGKRIDITLVRASSASTAVPLNIDVAALEPTLASQHNLSNIVGPGAGGTLAVVASSTLDLRFGIDLDQPATPRAYLDDATTLDAGLRVTGSGINFTFGAGPIVLTVTNASLTLDEDGAGGTSNPATIELTLTQDATDGRYLLAELIASLAQVDVTGQADATLPLFFPPGTPLGGPGNNNLVLDTTDLGDIVATTTITAPDIAAAAGGVTVNQTLDVVTAGVDAFLSKLQAAVDLALGAKLPLVGGALKDAAQFFADMRTKILTELGGVANKTAANVRQALANALLSEGLIDADADVQLLTDTATEVRYSVQLHKDLVAAEINLAFDLGLPAFQLSADPGSVVNVGIGLDYLWSFGVSQAHGFFVDTSPADEIDVTFGVTLPDVALKGTLALLKIDIDDNGSIFGGTVVFDLLDPTNGDGRLTLAELATALVNPTSLVAADITASAELHLGIEVGFGDLGKYQGVDTSFPSVAADLNIEWDFSPATGFDGSMPVIRFDDVRLLLGDFFDEFLTPIFEVIHDVFDPIGPVLDFITEPIPVFSDLIALVPGAPSETTLLTIAAKSFPFLEIPKIVIEVIQSLRSVNITQDGLALILGDFNLNGTDVRGLDDLTTVVPNIDGNFIQDALQAIKDLAEGTPFEDQVNDAMAKLADMKTRGLKFPIWEDPLSAIGMLFGKPVDIVTLNPGPIDFEAKFGKTIPLFGPLSMFLGGTVTGSVNFFLGFDTHGIQEFAAGNTDLAGIFTEGLYLRDTNSLGEDVPELKLKGLFGATASFSVLVAEAGVRGGVFVDLEANLADPDHDGRVRLAEIIEILESDPACLFDSAGEVAVGLEAFVTVGFDTPFGFVTLFEDRLVFAREVIVDLNHVCGPVADPDIAILENGVLRLYIGADAGPRNVGVGVTDETFLVELDLRNPDVATDDKIVVSFQGQSEEFDASAVNSILANNASGGNDAILIDPAILKPATLHGGDNNDTLKGGGGADQLFGDGGDDLLVGRAGNDTLRGGAGRDALVGDEGADSLEGGTQEDTLIGGAGDDHLLGEGGADYLDGGDDKDTLLGGSENDLLEGGAGDDSVLGEVGDDRLLGAGGKDTLRGGLGRDALFGDAGEDFLEGGEGNDDLFGGDDADILAGGAGPGTVDGNDLFFGEGGADLLIGDNHTLAGAAVVPADGAGHDTLFGGDGKDRLFGQGGNDVLSGDNGSLQPGTGALLLNDGGSPDGDDIFGGTGADQLFGQGGDDLMEGGEDDDVLFGGLGADRMMGGRSNATAGDPGGDDRLFGEQGNDTMLGDNGRFGSVTLIGGAGADTLVGGADDDLIFGQGGNDSIEGGTGHDTLVGGQGIDLVSGQEGNDAIEGGADLDILFGGGGQDDMIGGLGAVSVAHAESGLDTLDIMIGDAGDDVMLGDNGTIPVLTRAVTTRADGGAGADFMFGGVDNDVIFGGGFGDFLVGDAGLGGGADIVVGDQGTRTAISIVALHSVVPDSGGDDDMFGSGGIDIMLGGDGADQIEGGTEGDVMVGDNGVVALSAVGLPVRVTSTAGNGSNDTIIGNGASDIAVGGDGDDNIWGDDETGPSPGGAGDILLGDNGVVVRADGTALANDIFSTDPTFGGEDQIHGGPGDDILIGGSGGNDATGVGGDDLFGEAGHDIIIGDNARITRDSSDQIEVIETTEPQAGGDDVGEGADGADTMLGGSGADTMTGGLQGDVILGDNGRLVYNRDLPLDLDLITTTNPTFGASDQLFGGDGNDTVMGGTASETIDGGNGDDLLFGDHGKVDRDIPSDRNFFSVDTGALDGGAADEIHGNVGRDTILGGQAGDLLLGEADDDDLIGGHNAAGGSDAGDVMDGGTGNDALAGDNASIIRRLDTMSPIVQALVGTTLYGAGGAAAVSGAPQANPTGAVGRDIILFDHSDTAAPGTFGNDTMAGGAQNDTVLGQLGDDLIQGDASTAETIGYAGGVLNPSVGSATDGDDYIEGNGGADLIFGDFGQDDILGGSSDLFGLINAVDRPDGADVIFGGAGTETGRNHLGDLTNGGHARDADVILGDNGRIFRIVGTGGVSSGAFLTYNYDNYADGVRIIPRAVDILDYTPGAAGGGDRGAGDLIHGEAGDDSLWGGTGDDVLYGEGQDDDVLGGAGDDWASGGTGEDAVLGDDGKVITSRNGLAEPLAAVAALPASQLNLAISTPGSIQQATINVAGQLRKAVDLEPFDLGGDDVLYGGLGNDSMHGGAGDDAMSGAEALLLAAAQLADGTIVLTGYDTPVNVGGMLAFNPVDVDGQNGQRTRAGEFLLYDEYNPLKKIMLTSGGQTLEFFLNVPASDADAPLDPRSTSNPKKRTDGDDKMFGDLGNDWIVGGTGRDDLYGGYGNDLLQADDDLSTNGGLNTTPDTDPSYEDRAFGGAGRDVLIGNTGGDRLIDWVGEFNSYLVPFAPFGMATVSRTLQPQLAEFLYALSASDGADPTRAADTGADPARNGEPFGELGLVRQQDFDWHDQTGAPSDPEAGNIPGGPRDVLRSANFNSVNLNSNILDGFAPDSGTWTVSGGTLQVTAQSKGKDAAAVYQVGDALPIYFEVQASISVIKPTAGWKANAYIIFDYINETDFKFTGLDVSLNRLVMGHRNASGWVLDRFTPFQAKADIFYNMTLAVNGFTAMLIVNNQTLFSNTYAPRVIDGVTYALNWGLVGMGSDNSRGAYDNIKVQVLPPQATFQNTEDYSDGVANLSVPQTGTWQVSGGRYIGTPPAGGSAFSLLDLGVEQLGTNSALDLSAKLNTAGRAGLIFDWYGPEDFKFVAIDAPADQVIIGHYVRGAWVTDSFVSKVINAGTDYTVGLTLRGPTVSVSVDGQVAISRAYNAVTVDGGFGLFAKGAVGSFDNVSVKTNDPDFAGGSNGLVTDSIGTGGTSALAETALAPVVGAAMEQWHGMVGSSEGVGLDSVRFAVADLSGALLGLALNGVIYLDVDAAGHGWFIDPTPMPERHGDTTGRIDLLSVVMHELGHTLGLEHENADEFAIMEAVLTSSPQHGLVFSDSIAAPGTLSAARDAVTEGQASAAATHADLIGLAPWRDAPPSSWVDRFASALGLSVDWQDKANGGWRDLWPFGEDKAGKVGRASNLVDFRIDLGSRATEEGNSDGLELVGVALDAKGGSGRDNRELNVNIDWNA